MILVLALMQAMPFVILAMTEDKMSMFRFFHTGPDPLHLGLSVSREKNFKKQAGAELISASAGVR